MNDSLSGSVDGGLRDEGLEEDFQRTCYQSSAMPKAVLDRTFSSWDFHTEEDLENILLDYHAIVTTMYITEPFLFYKEGIFSDPDCDDWELGPDRDDQWKEAEKNFYNNLDTLKPLRHSVTIVGFGEDEVRSCC